MGSKNLHRRGTPPPSGAGAGATTTTSTVRSWLMVVFMVLGIGYLYQLLQLLSSSFTVRVDISSQNVSLLHLETFVQHAKHSRQEKASSWFHLLEHPREEREQESQEGVAAAAAAAENERNPNHALIPLQQQMAVAAGGPFSSSSSSATTTSTRTSNKRRNDDEKKEEEESFSACLLIMDENHRLPEWLAYHYYMLPLRHLFVLTDPKSSMDPSPIIERWKPYMDIYLLTDETQVGHKSDQQVKGGALRDHRRRQNKFYKACLEWHHAHNRTWVTTHDADEFLYLDPKKIPDAVPRMQKPGSILTYLHDAMDPPVAAADVTTNNNNINTAKKVQDRSCVSVLRTYVGSKEEPASVIQRDIPSEFNASHFDTLRYLHRLSHYFTVINGPPKSLIRVSTIDLTLRTHGVHELFPECSEIDLSPPLRIRHYVGSWEAFTSRVEDARIGYKRSRETWEYRSEFGSNNTIDDSVRGWLAGFIQQIGGIHAAQHLLQGAGQVPSSSSSSSNMDWNMKPEAVLQELRGQGPFKNWLKRRGYYEQKLPNGTSIVGKRDTTKIHKDNT